MTQSKVNNSSAVSKHGPGARASTAPASVPRPAPRPSPQSLAPKRAPIAALSLVPAAPSSRPRAVGAAAKSSPAPSAIKSTPPRPSVLPNAPVSVRRSPPPPPAPLPRAMHSAPSAPVHRSTPPPLPVTELTLLTEYDLIDDEAQEQAPVRAEQPKKKLEEVAAPPPARAAQPPPIAEEIEVECFSCTEPPPRPRSRRRGALIGAIAALTLAAGSAVFCYGFPAAGGHGRAQAGTSTSDSSGNASRQGATTPAKTELARATVASPIAAANKAPHPKAATQGKHNKPSPGRAKPHPKPQQKHQALADGSVKL